MIDHIVVFAGTVLGVGGLLVAAIIMRPRPASIREVVYLVVPLAGAVALAALAWSRV